MIDSSGDDHYYAHDHLFSPVALIDDDGTVEERYEYDAYGRMTRLDPDFTAWSGTPAGNPYYFTGQRLDDLDGDNHLLIMYYKNRYYLVDIGRFITFDPIGIRDGICNVDFSDFGSPYKYEVFSPIEQYSESCNLFEYVLSEPIGLLDPLGEGCKVYYICVKISEKKSGMRKHCEYVCGEDKSKRRRTAPMVGIYTCEDLKDRIDKHVVTEGRTTHRWGCCPESYKTSKILANLPYSPTDCHREECREAVNDLYKKMMKVCKKLKGPTGTLCKTGAKAAREMGMMACDACQKP